MRPEHCGSRKIFIFAGLFLSAFLTGFASAALADDWRAPLYDEGAPEHLVGIDKKNHTFNFFEKKSPLKLRYSYPCVTGQLPGDKQQINDLRTPEGIYFVEYKIAGGLDFREYGGIAYTLNYPNPVDRLRGKTGHGIWIHSKGFGLSPTKGCVAINLQDIAEIGPRLVPGTAVIVGEELREVNQKDNGTLGRLRALMDQWSRAWESRSAELFKFYDPEAYTLATENFTAFRQNKERLFKILSYIKIYNREIHALEGPGYWVTWSEQFYTASNLSTEGIRRLYWQKNDSGDFRIVGMEWTPRDLGMAADFKKGVLVARAQSPVVTDAASEIPVAPKLDMPEQAEDVIKPQAVQTSHPEEKKESAIASADITASIQPVARNMVELSEPLVPKKQPRISPPAEFNWGSGNRVSEPPAAPVQEKRPGEPAPGEQVTVPSPLEFPVMPDKNLIHRELSKQPLKDETKKAAGITIHEVRTAAEAWIEALRNRDRSITGFYDQKDYNRVPPVLGMTKGASLKTLLQRLNHELNQKWLMVITRPAEIEIQGDMARTSCEQMLVDAAGTRQGVRSQWWRKDEHGVPRIVAENFKAASLGMEANYLEAVSEDITRAIEDWRKDWEAGNLEKYIEHYATDASQQGKTGRKTIRSQKEQLWSRITPTKVVLSGLRLSLDGKGIRADMNQQYADSAGRSDKGVKTMFLRYNGQKWLIQREDWVDAAQASR